LRLLRDPALALVRAGAVVAAVMAAGCASVAPQPFATFSSSVVELRQGSDQVLGVMSAGNRARFVDRVTLELGRGDASTLNDALMLDFVAPFGWTYAADASSAPLYVESQRFRAGVAAMNDVLVRYAGLLAELASSGLVRSEDFDEMAKRLNGDLLAASRQLGIASDGGSRGLALFSVAAARAAHAYIEGQRREQLIELLEATQPDIDRVSAKLVDAMRIAAQNAAQSYFSQREPILDRIPDADESTRRENVVALIELNQSFTRRLEMLRRLDHAYESLPAAHRELRRAVETPTLSMVAVKDLHATGRELHALYREIEASSAR
jgi:hypothetical protein